MPETIREFANFLVGVARSGITGTPPLAVAPPSGTDIDTGSFKIEARFDPARFGAGGADADLDDPALVKLKNYLAQFGVQLDVVRPPEMGSSNGEEIAAGCSEMVCYRFVLPYHIIVSDPEVSKTRAEAILLLPNEGPVAGIRVVRRSLVENKFNLTFTDGVLTKAEYEDPSALLGALMIPIDALKAIVSIPSALFRFTIATETDIAELNAERDLLEAQRELAAKQLELLKAQGELEEAQTGSPGQNP